MKDNGVKLVGVVVLVVGALGGHIAYNETTYARAADVKDIKNDIIELRLTVVEDRLFDLRRIEQARQLTDIEKARMNELMNESDRLKGRLKK